jgi:RNA polymerase sigma factor (sigma-70 family)
VSTPVTDEDLMLRVQEGDQAAMEVLVRRYHRSVVVYLYRLSLDHHLAQDLAQECLFRLVGRAALYRHPQPLRPWLYRIATNIWRDHVKSAAYRAWRAERPEGYAGEWAAEQACERGGWQGGEQAGLDRPVEEIVENRLLAAVALTALEQLDALYREALLLRFCEDLTVPEIAHVLDIPEGTVKSRIFHGLRRLRACLGEEAQQGHADRAGR